jgi:copper chaperone CopZ
MEVLKLKKIIIKTEGMTCGGCEAKIENKLKKQEGILSVKADSAKNIVHVSYEEDKIGVNEILSTIENLHYSAKVIEKEETSSTNVLKLLGVGAIIAALYMIINNTIGFNFIPEVNQNMGYGMLFVVGLITSLHCMAMCGGINLSQCIKYRDGKTRNHSKG